MTLAERYQRFRASSPLFTTWLPIASLVYLAALRAVGGLAPEHFAVVALVAFFSFWSDKTRNFTRVGFPFILYAVVYDSMRWYAHIIRSPVVHVREPYDFDLRWFPIEHAGKILTPNEWWQLHTHPVLDFFTGLSYTPFFFIGESLLLSFWLFLRGHEKWAVRFTWAFVIANFCGFAVYYIYPAAPPWYVQDFGFEVNIHAAASPAGAARFDALLGFPLMASFYSKSADVFGAIPSLHVVYPLLAMLYGWSLPRFRLFAVPYFALVCFSAVYLNHHYLIDLFIGWGIALGVMLGLRLALGRIDKSRVAAASPAEPVAQPQPAATRDVTSEYEATRG